MKDWFRRFFAVDNSINENTVMGVIFALALLVAVFVKPLAIGEAARYTLAGAMGAFFGLSLGKK